MTPRRASPKGDLPKAACGLVGICRLRRFDVVRRMISDNAYFSEAMTQEDMAREHRNPSRHRIEEHDVLNWLKANRKALNAGKMKEERTVKPRVYQRGN